MLEAAFYKYLIVSPLDRLDALLPLGQLTDRRSDLNAPSPDSGVLSRGLMVVVEFVADVRELDVELVELLAELRYDFFLDGETDGAGNALYQAHLAQIVERLHHVEEDRAVGVGLAQPPRKGVQL
jgi:hypothetical protein